MQRFLNKLRAENFYYSALFSACILLSVIVLTLPVEFTSYRAGDSFAPFWYALTRTAGTAGSIVIVSFIMLWALLRAGKSKPSLRDLTSFFLIIIIAEVFLVGLFQLAGKEMIRNPRPSQIYLTEKGVIENYGREFYSMPMNEKEDYLGRRVTAESSKVKHIYPPLLDDWISDGSFSFPSGHAQSAFFLGTILSYAIYLSLPGRRRKMFIVPLIWALLIGVSRVVTGSHFPRDVIAGSLVGIFFGVAVIQTVYFTRIFQSRN